MAKIYGINGAMSGKLGNTVMSVRNGEQLARQYQPVVYNPSTPSQIASRAKLKLMSQLSAVFAPYIAFRRVGAKSVRNMFVSENYKFTTYADNAADIALTSVRLTKSVVSLPSITTSREGNTLNVTLDDSAVDLNRVVYVVMVRQDDGTLRSVNSAVATEAGPTSLFPAAIDMHTSASLPFIVYAYGVRDNTEAARVAFANMVVDAQNVANVVTSRTLTEADITLTETKAAVVAVQP